jgi:hypothetical protein
MSGALALISGTLFKSPKACVSKAGTPFTACTVKVKDGGEKFFWRVLVFSTDAQTELALIDDGDGVSARGLMKAEIYQPETGSPRVNFTFLADALLPLVKPARKTKSRSSRSSRSSSEPPPMAPGMPDYFGDDLPF